MKKRVTFVYSIFLLLCACSGKEEIEKWPAIGSYYDASKPTSVEEISPTWGGIDQIFVLKGNFPKDTAQLKVYFADREAVLLNCDGNCLMGMVPKQLPGYNPISLVVNDKPVTNNLKFKYYQTASVKTIAGKFKEDKTVTGNLSEARLSWVTSIGTVKGQKGDNIIAVEGEWGDRINLISQDDNNMIKIGTVQWTAGPAVDNSREKFYVCNRDGKQLYCFARKDGWMSNLVGVSVGAGARVDGEYIVGCLAFGDDDRYLYALTSQGCFVRTDLQEKTGAVLLRGSDFDGVVNWWHYLTYSKFHKCFFASSKDAGGIYRIFQTEDGKWKTERYAGFNNGNKLTLGHRLNDAVLKGPQGLTVNALGEIYVVCRDAHCIVKIAKDMVSLVAGKPGTYAQTEVNGSPLEALFDQPLCITTDADDNFFVGAGMERTVRKLTIE